MHNFKEIISGSKTLNKLVFEIKKELSRKNLIHCSSLFGLTSFILGEIHKNYPSIILICKDASEIERYRIELEELRVNTIIQNDFETENLNSFVSTIISNNKFILLTTKKVLVTKFPDLETVITSTFEISIGDKIRYNDIVKNLREFDYQEISMIEAPGEYSLRGSVIDVWPYGEDNPVRIEFEFNDIVSIRYFDPISQRSINEIGKIIITKSFDTGGSDELPTKRIFDFLTNPLIFISEELLLNNSSSRLYPSKLNINEKKFEEILNDISIEKDVKIESEDIDYEDLLEFAKVVVMNSLEADFKSEVQPAPIIKSNYDLLFSYLENYLSKKDLIFIISENEVRKNNFVNLLENSSEIIQEGFSSGKIKIFVNNYAEGFYLPEDKILVFTSYQIFDKPFRKSKYKNLKNKKSLLTSYKSIKIGDYVVHEKFGIAQYLGLTKIKIGDNEQESIKLLYDGGDVVYVNVNYLHLVKKFSAEEGIKPQLSNLNSGQWDKTKLKVKKKITELARELITLYAKRKTSQGFAFSDDTLWQKELEESFIYEETADQLKVWEEIKADMMSPNPMDRLLCGDVGFGKTEIAVRAAFKAVQDNKQVAVLVPTTILAEQHYNTFIDRLNQFGVKICQLSRFITASQQKEIIKQIAEGKFDIVIGTHRIISDDVKFKNLGLLIVDEEHRFGVKAKEKLKELKVNVDTLTMTATPIPRTLNFSLLGARDLSLIATPPPNRLPVQVSVEVFNINNVRQYILNEINRKGQVYFIHDRVETIEKIRDYLSYHIPEATFTIAHGKLTPAQLEKNLSSFISGKVDVLISTKIIESGIDIPNANTIIINRADRFGLAELYQLKGRVGRSNRQAFAYFLVPSKNAITKKARLRLKAIEDFSDLGEGFNISLRDLEIRGAGNLLGYEQSGVIDNIGFDLYLKLIDEAVNELKNNEFKEIFSNIIKQRHKIDTNIDTFFDISIPDEYMPNETDRVMFYSALFSFDKLEDLNSLIEEMIDRFGKYPEQVETLINLSKLKYYASYCMFDKLIIRKDFYIFVMPPATENFYYENYFQKFLKFLAANYSDKYKLHQDNKILSVKFKHTHRDDVKQILTDLLKFTKDCVSVLYEDMA
jgi:transcription-repair coupling factor (superfamily II helicase)